MSALVKLEQTQILNESANNAQQVDEAPRTTNVRGEWNDKMEFFLTCVGYAVGLGNVWRFPYLCFKNGGGAFLIPYTFMLAFLGLPLFFLELAFGQFASLGPISVWSVSPLFKGIGYSMVFLSWLLNVYYQIIIVHCFYYFCVSFTSTLPWKFCNPSWSSPLCTDSLSVNVSNNTNTKSPPEEYYNNRVLKLSSGFEDFGQPSWELALLLFFAWVICALAVIKGVQSLGKVSYITGLFPYLMLTILLVRGVLLPGSGTGVLYYLTPDFSRLSDPKVWTDAATQIFFSLGCCNGGLITVSSYNKFKNNCCRDAVLVAVINCATSVYAGFVIFANLGFMAFKKNTTVAAVASGGPGLAFIVYPEAITNMPLSSLWSVLFFLMMMILGFGSQFSILETTLSGVQDELRKYGFNLTEKRKILFRTSVCFFDCMMGLPMVCAGGYYLLTIYDTVMSNYGPLVVAFFETAVIAYVYGLQQFRRDIEMMINERPNWYWKLCWGFFAPMIALFLTISALVKRPVMAEFGYTFPSWTYVLYDLLSCVPFILIIGSFLYCYCSEGGFFLLKEFLKPVHEWGPADKSHRAEFISLLKERASQRVEEGRQPAIEGPVSHGSHLRMTTSVDNSIKSGLTAAGMVPDTKFFQSKLNVAEKFTEAHTKEVVKRVASNSDMSPAHAAAAISASQTALAAAVLNKLTSKSHSNETKMPEQYTSSSSQQGIGKMFKTNKK